ncbi:MAG: host attachment protein [Alphaproteobacteria bacterium]|nr:host attachment protein [Alphaproteobacteria bacterium]MBM3624187.1 host attachment protein [Alphaproteobacteria bacterium]
MSEFSIGNGAWVLVGDGRRALFFQNHGDAELLDLRVIETRIDENPATREQGTDKPGRSFASKGGVRSAVQDADWHEMEEERFARAMADRINRAAESGELNAIAIVAPPRVLGEIRKELSAKAQSKVVGELAKDLTRHPLKDIEKALTRG